LQERALPVDVNAELHHQLKICGITLAASLPDDWVAPLIERIAADNSMRHVRVAREAEAVAICSGAFFGGVRSAALMGATGLLTCTGELATLNLRHAIPVFLIVSQRGTVDDHRIYQEVQGRKTKPLLDMYDFPYQVIDKPEDLPRIPDCYETCRLQKRPFILFLARQLMKGDVR
jgi:sulfopyruvate decarboxylase subunit alpha